MRKRPLVCIVLIVALAGLLFARYQQSNRPLYPDIVSIRDERRNMALTRIRNLSDDQKRMLRDEMKPSLRDTDARVRRYALYAIRKLNVPDDNTGPLVTPLFSDPDASVREEAISALVDMGTRGLSAGKIALVNGDGVGAQSAATYFERLGPESLPELRAVLALRATDEGQRAAALTLIKLAPSSKQAVPVFEAILKKGFDADVVKALEKMGPLAKTSVPLLRTYVLSGSDSLINENAQRPLCTRVLSVVDPRSTDINNLSWDLKNKDELVRYRAVTEWGRKKDLDSTAIPAMVGALRDSNVFVAARAADVLVRLDIKNVEPLSKIAYPALRDLNQRVSDSMVEGYRERVGAKIDALFQGTQSQSQTQ